MGGGASVATFNIARGLVRLGHHVDIITSKLSGQKSEENVEGMTIYRVTSFRRGIHDCGYCGALSYLLFAAFRFIQLTRKNKYDVIYYFFCLPTGALSLLPGKHKRIPYIISLRGSDVPLYDMHNEALQLVHKLLKPVTKHILRKAKKITALSESLKATALQTYPDMNIEVIPNGIELDMFSPCEHAKSNGGKMRLLTVSRLVERKGIQHILNALAQLREENISLVIVGAGCYESYLKTLCNKLQLESVVSFYGFCLRDHLPRLYNESDIFCLPSLAESFGVVLVEAMACGLPIISTKTGGIPDLIGSENGILVDPGNVDEIRKAILMLKNNEKMRMDMGNASREKVAKNYTWEKVTQKYLKIYNENQL
jgi:glycosyltransferase involved in cell wall biosynthesis